MKLKKSVCFGLSAALAVLLAGVYFAGYNEEISDYENVSLNENSNNVTIVESGKCGENAAYELDSEGTLRISGTGEMTNYGLNSPFYDSSNIKTAVIEDGITSIGHFVFSGCRELESITIPNGITSIDDCAFSGCSGLESVTIPNSVTNISLLAFADCSGLKSVAIPDSVTNIDFYAFGGCSGLESVTIPNSVTSIGPAAFTLCADELILYVEQNSYAEDYAIDNNINYAFYMAGDEITIPKK